MRPLACLAGGILATGAMSAAYAQSLAVPGNAAAMLQTPLAVPSSLSDLAFDQKTVLADRGLVRQNITEASRLTGSGSVDTLRVTVAESAVTPAGYPSLMVSPDQIRDRAYQMEYSRSWPGAAKGKAGGYQVEFTPEARIGIGEAGGTIGGSAMVKVMSPSADAKVVDRLAKMGVKDGGQYGDQGRWYAFAAASGRAVGFSMAPGAQNGWTTDPAALVSDAQLGVGWRKGDTQTSLGYMVRRVKVEDHYAHQITDVPDSDQVVGLSFSYKPRPR